MMLLNVYIIAQGANEIERLSLLLRIMVPVSKVHLALRQGISLSPEPQVMQLVGEIVH